jgi:solute carrier family 25 citrate transporter 1
VAYDQYKSLLQDANGNISGPRTVIAGFGAGVTESLFAVTPFESIKTTLYTPLPLPIPGAWPD